jgi:general stress protein YciG
MNFAHMTREKHREIASKGGRAAQASGKARRLSGEQARVAGRLGGAAMARDREHMRRIGRAGGLKTQQKKRAEKAT